MHTDESVQGIKFGELLEQNYYRYDQIEYHGPTLYYFTLIPAWVLGEKNIQSVSEKTLRIVPVFFGFLLIPVLFLFGAGLGRSVLIAAACLTAVSPAMVFYSRYYIQEMLLVSFTFAAIASGYRYATSDRKIPWAIAAGAFLGLAHATKETYILAFGMLLVAFMVTMGRRKETGSGVKYFFSQLVNRNTLPGILTGIIVSALFYSSFFTNPAGVIDSYMTYVNYLGKAGVHDWHIHPWWYYLKLLSLPNGFSPMMWGEFYIFIFACFGVYAAMKKKKTGEGDPLLLRFLVVFTLGLAVIYSIIPYKTPWSMLSFHQGLIILAALGIVHILKFARKPITRYVALVFVVWGGMHLVVQSVLLNYRYEANPINPYVYAHTSPDIFRIVDRVDELAKAHPDGKNMYIEVVCSENDYWPLPWYLRDYKNTGWWDHVEMNVPAAPVIIISPDCEDDLIRKLYELPPPGEKNLYLPLFEQAALLRPYVELYGYVVKDLWDRAERMKEE